MAITFRASSRALRTSEVAAVVGVDARVVNNVLDEHILPSELFSLEGGRELSPFACFAIAFYYGTAKLLTSDARRLVIERLNTRLGAARRNVFRDWNTTDWIVHEGTMTLDLSGYAEQTGHQLVLLWDAVERVVSDPEILNGVPVIKGTRVPVYEVAASIAAGYSTETLLDAYPALKESDLEMASLYVKANPMRGRPRQAATLPEVAKLVSHSRVPRAGKR